MRPKARTWRGENLSELSRGVVSCQELLEVRLVPDAVGVQQPVDERPSPKRVLARGHVEDRDLMPLAIQHLEPYVVLSTVLAVDTAAKPDEGRDRLIRRQRPSDSDELQLQAPELEDPPHVFRQRCVPLVEDLPQVINGLGGFREEFRL